MLLPSLQSCATWVYAISRLSSPMRVTPSSCTVPRLMVQYSRITLRSPMTRRLADRGELEDLITGADLRVAGDQRVRPDPGIGSDHHVRADHAVGTHLNV